MTRAYGQACPVARTLELVGERWTLLVVRDLLAGPRRFQDLQESLPGVAPNMLSARLKRMEAHGLIRRRFYSDHPPRASYELTEKGRELGVVVGALAAWGSRHVHTGTALVTEECGHTVQIGYFCPACNTRVRGGTVKLGRTASAGAFERVPPHPGEAPHTGAVHGGTRDGAPHTAAARGASPARRRVPASRPATGKRSAR
jgi:DNA-binding HxlR family transcriptional regulator